jgi:hypothetical protein
MTAQFKDFLRIPNAPKELKAAVSHAIDLARASQKFLLPIGGIVIEDREYKALDGVELRLPFPFIALEYEYPQGVNVRPGEHIALKRIVFARERDDSIAIMPAFFANERGVWSILPEVYLPKAEYLERGTRNADGWVAPMLFRADARVPDSDYADEVVALLSFLNATQCSNVRMDHRITSARRPEQAHKFDSYRVLTIEAPAQDGGDEAGGSHRSPREHLRRGHVRRLSDGRRLWINATVVAAGRGAGVVTKDYAVGQKVPAVPRPKAAA